VRDEQEQRPPFLRGRAVQPLHQRDRAGVVGRELAVVDEHDGGRAARAQQRAEVADDAVQEGEGARLGGGAQVAPGAVAPPFVVDALQLEAGGDQGLQERGERHRVDEGVGGQPGRDLGDAGVAVAPARRALQRFEVRQQVALHARGEDAAGQVVRRQRVDEPDPPPEERHGAAGAQASSGGFTRRLLPSAPRTVGQ
jgi:hypothetical protein